MLAGWIDTTLADCGTEAAAADAAAADAAAADAVGDATAATAGTGNPWEVRRADAKLFWRFLVSFLRSLVLILKTLSCMLIYILCTSVALTGQSVSVAGKVKILGNGVGSLAYKR